MSAPPESLVALVERFEPDVFDAPGGRARIRLATRGRGVWDADVNRSRVRLQPAGGERVHAEITADGRALDDLSEGLAAGMDAFRRGRISLRGNTHAGLSFLAAVSAHGEDGRLRLARVRTRAGRVATMEAGTGRPILMLHGLGGTKFTFLPTIASLATDFRTIAMDAPGFGDSDKPFGRYDAAFMARWAVALLDKLGIEKADVLGHSMGGRVALELGMRHPDRVRCLMLMTPSMAWRTEKRWARPLRLLRPELGLFQPAPRPVVEAFVRRIVPGASGGWSAASIDEFLRAYLTPRGRMAFYAAARQIYLEDGDGPDGFWERLEHCAPRSLFLWGRRDQLVPIGFARHVARALPSAEHVELDCGHVPQYERPGQTHAALTAFLRGARAHGRRARPAAVHPPRRRAQSGKG
ncbi:MAG TPA: alpha/beta fold hydrolase [Thermoleophilaceae bacterium]|jgi:pimeloyl-ACP methyl ester carboxylesterase